MKKIIQAITSFFVSIFFIADNVSAALLYGIPAEEMAPPPSPSILEAAFWTLEKVLAFILLPVVIVVAFIVGIVIYIKRKKTVSNVAGDIQNRQA